MALVRGGCRPGTALTSRALEDRVYPGGVALDLHASDSSAVVGCTAARAVSSADCGAFLLHHPQGEVDCALEREAPSRQAALRKVRVCLQRRARGLEQPRGRLDVGEKKRGDPANLPSHGRTAGW
jgi:hypothetical protein